MKVLLVDNGGRRLGIERRQYFYSVFIPESRSGKDRRSIKDRRIGMGTKRTKKNERRKCFKEGI